MKTSPTQRSLAFMRKHGYRAAVVEHFNPHVKIRQDLFGFGDVIAIGQGEIVLIQTTSASNFSSRMKKVQESDAAGDWIRNGGVIAVHGWKKKGARWTVRIERIEAGDFFKQENQKIIKEPLSWEEVFGGSMS